MNTTSKHIKTAVAERETGGGYADSGADWYVIRYADILLHRWFDPLRTGRALTVMNAKVSGPGKSTVGISTPIKDYQLLYPIPAIAVVTSSPAIVQNEGY
jgi:hypothetical protein